MISYFDVEDPKSDITFTVETPCFRIDDDLVDLYPGELKQVKKSAGKLFFTDDMVALIKDADIPQLRLFLWAVYLKNMYYYNIIPEHLHKTPLTITKLHTCHRYWILAHCQ